MENDTASPHSPLSLDMTRIYVNAAILSPSCGCTLALNGFLFGHFCQTYLLPPFLGDRSVLGNMKKSQEEEASGAAAGVRILGIGEVDRLSCLGSWVLDRTPSQTLNPKP